MQHKTDGYFPFVPSRADGAPGPLKKSERQNRAVEQVWQLAGDNAQTGRYSPAVTVRACNRISGGEASQAMSRARQTAEG